MIERDQIAVPAISHYAPNDEEPNYILKRTLLSFYASGLGGQDRWTLLMSRRSFINVIIGVLIWTLAVIQAFLPSLAFPFEPLDEHAHFAYATYLRVQGRMWPDFTHFPLYDQIGRALDTQNYINHPPTFYWLLALVQRIAPLAPAHQVWYRLLPLTGFGLAIVAYWLTQRLLKSSEFSAHAFMTVPLGLMVWATAPFVNNDMFGLLGGAIAVWGTVVLVGTNRSGGSILMATGLALASAKLNEFILVAIYCATVVWFVRKQKPAEARQIIIVGLFYIGLLLLPYLALFVTYGSPAPNTPGQSQTLHELALAQGLAATPRLSFPAYILRSLPDFLNAMGGGILFALTSTLVAAGLISGFIPSREQGGVEAVVARSAALATGATLILHLTVSYRTHQAYGVLLDMYPRYYFPLTSAYAIAAALAVGRFVGWWQLKGGPAANDMLPFMVRVAATLTSRPRC